MILPHNSESQSQIQAITYTSTYILEVPKISFLGSINLLEQLIEFREPCYLLDHWFTVKR